MAKWILEGCDEMGNYYYCSMCGYGIAIEEDFGDWAPSECPNCKAEMEAVDGEAD